MAYIEQLAFTCKGQARTKEAAALNLLDDIMEEYPENENDRIRLMSPIQYVEVKLPDGTMLHQYKVEIMLESNDE